MYRKLRYKITNAAHNIAFNLKSNIVRCAMSFSHVGEELIKKMSLNNLQSGLFFST